jgi:hypothetical protein
MKLLFNCEILPVTLFRELVPAIYELKVVRKPPMILKAGHGFTLEKIHQ